MKIKQKIFSLTSVITLILVVMMVLSNYRSQYNALNATTENQLDRYNDIFWHQVDADARSLEKLLTVLTNNQSPLINTFLSTDRDKLLVQSKPIFDKIKQQYDITHFYFIDTQGKVLLRVHNPEKHGDTLTRATYLQAKRSGATGKGIEMGKQYFSLRVVMPVVQNSAIVGYIELGQELEHLIGGFKNLTNADISMWVSQQYAQEKQLTQTFENVSNWYRVMSSDKSLHNNLIKTAAADLIDDKIFSFSFESESSDKHYRIKTFPFKDAFGKEAGILLIAKDITEQDRELSEHSFVIILSALVILFVVVIVSFYLSSSITRPLQETNAMLKDISNGDGDLTKRLEIKSADEVGELADNFNHFIEKLWGMMSNVATTAVQLSASSEKLSLSTRHSNTQITQQTQATEQVANAINKMSMKINEVSKNAHAAADAADTADQQAIQGKDIVQSTIQSINELASDVENSARVIAKLKIESESIGSVLDVIKGIAEQTNLLALNAAIEAARAGEQGRGFAVVADEVRTLAQRTQESTQEIETMIEALQQGTINAEKVMNQSRSRAGKTVEEASNANDSLIAITQSVTLIKQMNTQIADASEQQSHVSAEINKNVDSIQHISQQTRTGSENTMNSSRELASLGEKLQQIVKQFKV